MCQGKKGIHPIVEITQQHEALEKSELWLERNKDFSSFDTSINSFHLEYVKSDRGKLKASNMSDPQAQRANTEMINQNVDNSRVKI